MTKVESSVISKDLVEYEDLNGQSVRLNPATVRELIVIGNKDKVTDNEINVFMKKCVYMKLNPLIGDVYLIKWGDQCQNVTSVDYFLKRADMNPAYDGYETEFVKDGDELLCTCRVFRKDRGRPVSVTVRFSEYTTGKSVWNKTGGKPYTMLEKVAISQSHRKAFPNEFQGLYSQEEFDSVQTQNQTPEPVKMTSLKDVLSKAKKADDSVVFESNIDTETIIDIEPVIAE